MLSIDAGSVHDDTRLGLASLTAAMLDEGAAGRNALQIADTSPLPRMARRLGADAASAFGAGFGGSVWALVPERDAERFCTAWRSAYEGEFPMLASRASFFRSHAGPAVLRL